MLVFQYYSVKRSACMIAQQFHFEWVDEVSVKHNLYTTNIINNLVASHNFQPVSYKDAVRTVDISFDSR